MEREREALSRRGEWDRPPASLSSCPHVNGLAQCCPVCGRRFGSPELLVLLSKIAELAAGVGESMGVITRSSVHFCSCSTPPATLTA